MLSGKINNEQGKDLWRSSVQTVDASVCQHLITVRLQNAEGVPPENITVEVQVLFPPENS